MKLKAKIVYQTRWGEELVLCLNNRQYSMTYLHDGIWSVEIARLAIPASGEYHYEVMADGNVVNTEWRTHKLPVEILKGKKTVEVHDIWLDRPEDAPFYSSAFTEGIFGRKKSAHDNMTKSNLTLRVNFPTLRPEEKLALACSSLNDWKEFVMLDDSDFPEFTVHLEVEGPSEYKFVIVDGKSGKPLQWEEGGNRMLVPPVLKDSHMVCQVPSPFFAGRCWKGVGTAIPVFSLRTEDDFGIGEFYDLKKMVDWAALTRQNILQLLPINDTTMTGKKEDSYPYNAISTFALHPQFIHLPSAGVPEDEEYRQLQKELNALDKVDYERVNSEKHRLLRKAFATSRVTSRKAYKEYCAANSAWLLPYAVFSALRDEFGTAVFGNWGEYAVYSEDKVTSYYKKHKKEVEYYRFLQYHLHIQLSEVCVYAHAKGVVLKGDLPIGISRTSVDAWMHGELFHMDSQAGAPPDAFSETGQNWGFPTYNWEKMAEDGYAWWKARLGKMSEYFDAFRIDHILGFFRIWEIPMSSASGLDGYFNPALPYPGQTLRNMGFNPDDKGLFIEDPRQKGHYHPRIGARKEGAYNGLDWNLRQSFDNLYNEFFYRRHNEFWKQSALKKLPALLDSTGMLACGEDLGMIPATVPDVMRELKILSLEIQRMPKSVEETFANPARYPYYSVCTTSTHDMNPIRAWWEEDRHMTQRFYNEVLCEHGDAPVYCEPWVCRKILLQHLYSPAMLTILPLQDWLSMDGTLRYQYNPADERINVPANPRHYWRYRMHLTVEELIGEDRFNENLRNMIIQSR